MNILYKSERDSNGYSNYYLVSPCAVSTHYLELTTYTVYHEKIINLTFLEIERHRLDVYIRGAARISKTDAEKFLESVSKKSVLSIPDIDLLSNWYRGKSSEYSHILRKVVGSTHDDVDTMLLICDDDVTTVLRVEPSKIKLETLKAYFNPCSVTEIERIEKLIEEFSCKLK